jgi:acetyl-CoA carboxylase carboxyl transferase subunit alpha
MGVTSSKLEELGIVDATIPEPLGGAHRNPQEMAVRVKRHLLTQIDRLSSMDMEAMLEARYRRLMSYGN